jgi:hypothetical protein
MTEQEFLDIVLLHVETYHAKPEKKRPAHRSYNWDDEFNAIGKLIRRYGKNLKDINLDDAILVKWSTGGISGGNCWSGSDNLYSTEGEQEPEFRDLDVILENVCPKITYLEYKKLVHGIVEQVSWTDNEYYGNSTTYACKKVVLRKLWEKLQGMGLV